MKLVDFEVFLPFEKANIVGNNSRKVVIASLIKDKEKELPFLEKVLSAAKLDMSNDVALLLLTQGQKISLEKVLNQYSCDILIIFGDINNDIGCYLEHQKYQIFKWDGKSVLFAASIENIMVDKRHKAALWTNLQELFL